MWNKQELEQIKASISQALKISLKKAWTLYQSQHETVITSMQPFCICPDFYCMTLSHKYLQQSKNNFWAPSSTKLLKLWVIRDFIFLSFSNLSAETVQQI